MNREQWKKLFGQHRLVKQCVSTPKYAGGKYNEKRDKATSDAVWTLLYKAAYLNFPDCVTSAARDRHDPITWGRRRLEMFKEGERWVRLRTYSGFKYSTVVEEQK